MLLNLFILVYNYDSFTTNYGCKQQQAHPKLAADFAWCTV